VQRATHTDTVAQNILHPNALIITAGPPPNAWFARRQVSLT
jgi:hypothetical protein